MKNLHLISRKQAKAKGLKRYFTGNVCIKGHVEERMTSTGQCYGCLASDEYVKVKKACEKRLYQKNREKRTKQTKKYVENNREFVVAKRKEHYQKNKQKRNAYHKEWSAKNRGICNLYLAKYRADKIQRTPDWADIKAMQIEYELAAWCSKVMGEKYHVDHIIPLRGKLVSGLHVPSNLQVIPASKNLIKSNQFEV